jgi:hypothetical protein
MTSGSFLKAEPSHARQGFPLAGEIEPIGAAGQSATKLAADRTTRGLSNCARELRWGVALLPIARSMVPIFGGSQRAIPQRGITPMRGARYRFFD